MRAKNKNMLNVFLPNLIVFNAKTKKSERKRKYGYRVYGGVRVGQQAEVSSSLAKG